MPRFEGLGFQEPMDGDVGPEGVDDIVYPPNYDEGVGSPDGASGLVIVDNSGEQRVASAPAGPPKGPNNPDDFIEAGAYNNNVPKEVGAALTIVGPVNNQKSGTPSWETSPNEHEADPMTDDND